MITLGLSIVALGCGDDGSPPPPDGGGTDSGGIDSGGIDSGGTDSGGTDAGPGGTYCIEECTMDADCEVGGMDAGFTCVDGRCQAGAPGCTGDNECVAQASGWTTECAADSNCMAATQRCVDIGGGEGRCAFIPVVGVGCAVGTESTFPAISDGSDVMVCANTGVECRDGACFDPCEMDSDCSMPTPVCQTSTGRCVCADDSHCAGTPGASVCIDGECRCAADGDCSGVPNANRCFDGTCGCSDASVCSGDTAFDGTSFVCEAS